VHYVCADLFSGGSHKSLIPFSLVVVSSIPRGLQLAENVAIFVEMTTKVFWPGFCAGGRKFWRQVLNAVCMLRGFPSTHRFGKNLSGLKLL